MFLNYTDDLNDSDTSSDNNKTLQEMACMLHSHMATRDTAQFLGMAVTIPHPMPNRTICINVDPAKVCSLISCLSPCESIVVADGGCDTGLLGTDCMSLSIPIKIYQRGWF